MRQGLLRSRRSHGIIGTGSGFEPAQHMRFALDQRGPVEFRRRSHPVRVYDQLKLVSFRKSAISNYINNFNAKNGHGAQAWWHMAVRLSGIDAASGREGVLAGGEPIASPASLSPEAFNQPKGASAC